LALSEFAGKVDNEMIPRPGSTGARTARATRFVRVRSTGQAARWNAARESLDAPGAAPADRLHDPGASSSGSHRVFSGSRACPARARDLTAGPSGADPA